MKIILISDSHGNKTAIDNLIKSVDFDYLFFLGDGLKDLGASANLENVIVVSGNNDFFSDVANEKFFKLGEYNFFLTHGNAYGVKGGLSRLKQRAEELSANIVCFGHTHKKMVDKLNNIYYINPGRFFQDKSGDFAGIQLIIDEQGIEIKNIE